ncbi:hypothetical protein [Sinomonas sp.]|jgi:very-short-patch-repair endonuclease|uniref:hypothetical protein n=1 Tax=Sinomonas sp. TaxID=1914986 RepID=UPI002FE3C25B
MTDFPLPHPGPWLTSQLVERFGTRRAPRRLVAAGFLAQISRGIFYRADAWDKLPPDERHLILLAGHHEFHQAFQSASFAYSHLSAARLHGIDLWEPDDLIHLTLPASVRSRAHRPEVRVHAADISSGDLCDVRGLPVTRLENTVVDCARYLKRGQAQIVVDHGLRLGADRQRLEELAALAQGKRGILTARAALELGSELSESAGESLLHYLLSRMPFPMPTQQLVVVTRLGRYRVDFGWEDIRRGMEFDGKGKYFLFEPTDQAIFKERQREKAMMEEGWRFLRVEWRDLFREAELRARVGRFLGS